MRPRPDRRQGRWLPWSGLAFGAAAWAVSTQLNYALVPWVCATGINVVPAVALALALLAAAGGALSWHAWRKLAKAGSLERPEAGFPHRLGAAVGMSAAALFTLVILLHASAGLFFSGCER